MGISIEWLFEFFDAFIDGDAKEETEEYDCTETTWGVFKAYAFYCKSKMRRKYKIIKKNTQFGISVV